MSFSSIHTPNVHDKLIVESIARVSSMKSELHLSTTVNNEDNVNKLVTRLRSTSSQVAHTLDSNTCSSPSLADTYRESKNGSRSMDVFVQLHDLQRHRFLDLALMLYTTAYDQFPDVNMNVIPVLGRSRSGESSELGTLMQSDMSTAAEAGFHPVYDYVAVGGTFDHLHSGHKLMLTTAALYASKRLLIGVASDTLLQRKVCSEQLQPLETRKEVLRDFMSRIRSDLEVFTNTISDVAGGSDKIRELQALVLSPETKSAIDQINANRRANGGLPPLEPIYVPHVKASQGTILSSSLIREQLNRNC